MTQLQTEFDTPDASPGFLLWQISNKWQAQQRRALEPFGLTHVQFVLLACLTWSDHDGAMTQKRLADRAQTDVMMTSQVIRTLERKGLIARQSNSQDRRAMTLRSTPKGIKLVNQAIKVVESVDRDFFEKLGCDKTAFTELMHQLTD